MEYRVSGLWYKEITNVPDDSRYGRVRNVKVDPDSGQVRVLVVPGRLWLSGLLGRREDRALPWEAVRHSDVDIILTETPPLSRLGRGN